MQEKHLHLIEQAKPALRETPFNRQCRLSFSMRTSVASDFRYTNLTTKIRTPSSLPFHITCFTASEFCKWHFSFISRGRNDSFAPSEVVMTGCHRKTHLNRNLGSLSGHLASDVLGVTEFKKKSHFLSNLSLVIKRGILILELKFENDGFTLEGRIIVLEFCI